MNFSKLSPREQTLALMVALVMVGMLYGLLRLKPALADLEALHSDTKGMEAKITATEIPEPPDTSPEDLKKETEAINAQMAALMAEVEAMQSRFAPADSQDLQIRISEIARKSLVRIRDRKAFGIATGVGGASPNSVGGLKQAKKERKAARRAAKKAAQEAKSGKKPAIASPEKKVADAANPVTPLEEIKFPEPGGPHDMASLLSTDGKTKRPLQQLVIEGDFAGLRNFLAGLEQLPWLVTVVKMDVTVSGKEPPPGLPQPLTATLVISL